MSINSKFIFFNKKQTFEENKDKIPENINPIVFIKDTSQLYTCGTFFNLGYPDVSVSELSGQVKVNIGLESFYISTTGDSLSIRKGENNKIIINSSALTKINTSGPISWDTFSKVLSHDKSEVLSGLYGLSTDLNNASILEIPFFAVDQYGHVVKAGYSTVQIRDYVEQVAPSDDNIERNIIQSYDEENLTSNTSQVRKANGLTFNDNTKILKVEGGINSEGGINIQHGDLNVKDGYIVGNLKGDISGSATPKIHLSEKPEYGGASKTLYGHVTLLDDVPGIKPPESSNNINATDSGIDAVAASPLMVWNALDLSKKYSDDNKLKVTIIEADGEKISITGSLNFTLDFNIDENNNLSLNWLEIK